MTAKTSAYVGGWLLAASCVACGGTSSTSGPSPASTPTPVAATPAPSPAPSVDPTPAPTPTPGAQTLRTASIRGANGHSASGTARIVAEGDGFRLDLGNDFRIDSGNNDVYLARDSRGVSPDDLNLGNMRALTGAQTYRLPNAGSQYRFVLLWCRPFRVPIGVGELQ